MYFPKDRRTKAIITAVVLVLVAGGLIALFVSRQAKLSQSFAIARKNASDVSQRIVELTSQTGDKITAANKADLSGDSARAQALLEEASGANAEANRNAADLAGYLKDLATSLSSVRSVSSQRLAYEAIATDLSLVSEFVAYTRDLDDFLEKLATAIDTGSGEGRRDAATALAKVNEGAKKINALNADFRSRMDEFDKSL